jgi:hypothetical protein
METWLNNIQVFSIIFFFNKKKKFLSFLSLAKKTTRMTNKGGEKLKRKAMDTASKEEV